MTCKIALNPNYSPFLNWHLIQFFVSFCQILVECLHLHPITPLPGERHFQRRSFLLQNSPFSFKKRLQKKPLIRVTKFQKRLWWRHRLWAKAQEGRFVHQWFCTHRVYRICSKSQFIMERSPKEGAACRARWCKQNHFSPSETYNNIHNDNNKYHNKYYEYYNRKHYNFIEFNFNSKQHSVKRLRDSYKRQ